jgi:predicted enzyme related to lactoylglutathione lyase
MANPVVHWELWSQEPSTVSEFYAKVFDWKINHIPEMNYHLVETGGPGGINGGIMKPMEGWTGNMAMYIDVDDIAPYRKRIAEAGGKIIVEELEVPGMGKFSLFADPDGRVLGIWQRTPKG